MVRTSFNDGWDFGPKAGLFPEPGVSAAPPRAVMLPHDAMIERDRDANAPGGPASGYFPGGVYTYQKTFHVPEAYRTKRITLEFEGIYRQAMVFINGDLAGQCASG